MQFPFLIWKISRFFAWWSRGGDVATVGRMRRLETRIKWQSSFSHHLSLPLYSCLFGIRRFMRVLPRFFVVVGRSNGQIEFISVAFYPYPPTSTPSPSQQHKIANLIERTSWWSFSPPLARYLRPDGTTLLGLHLFSLIHDAAGDIRGRRECGGSIDGSDAFLFCRQETFKCFWVSIKQIRSQIIFRTQTLDAAASWRGLAGSHLSPVPPAFSPLSPLSLLHLSRTEWRNRSLARRWF